MRGEECLLQDSVTEREAQQGNVVSDIVVATWAARWVLGMPGRHYAKYGTVQPLRCTPKTNTKSYYMQTSWTVKFKREESTTMQVEFRLTWWERCTGPLGSSNSTAYVKGPAQSSSVIKLRWEWPSWLFTRAPVEAQACLALSLCIGHRHSHLPKHSNNTPRST